MSKPAGRAWCKLFPTERTTAGLVPPFRGRVQRFITALEAAGIHVSLTATRRPGERAYLMHWAWRIAREGYPARNVPRRAGVDIQWDLGDEADSQAAAAEMVAVYGLVVRPSLTSRHIDGLALDMNVEWSGVVEVVDGDGEIVYVDAAQGTENNPVLHRIGASYGVHKLKSDPPHWSSDGR